VFNWWAPVELIRPRGANRASDHGALRSVSVSSARSPHSRVQWICPNASPTSAALRPVPATWNRLGFYRVEAGDGTWHCGKPRTTLRTFSRLRNRFARVPRAIAGHDHSNGGRSHCTCRGV